MSSKRSCVTPPIGLLHKGAAVEEWIDLRFFRPLGVRLVRRLAPTRVSPDQVTLGALLVGLVAGHLFVYPSFRANALGLGLFVLSEILDSADGQLARLRGSSTRLGAVLDGISDNARFLNLYLHLLARVLLAARGPAPLLIGLAAVAGASHALQAAVADFIRQVYLLITTGRGGRLDLPEDLAERSHGPLAGRVVLALYRPYVRRQARWCPRSVALVRALRRGAAPSSLPEDWERAQAGVLRGTALLGQNIRFLLLALTALPGWPEGFFWVTAGPLNLALLCLLLTHERTATRLAGGVTAAGELAPAGEAF